jgi:hypothetical protein
MIDSTDEARVFGKYLIGQAPNEEAVLLYSRAMRATHAKLDETDIKLLQLVMAHPRLLGFIDAGLPFYKPYSEVRRRLYVMLAILETQPQYHDIFLPKARSPWYILFILYAGFRAVVKTVFGSILVRTV